MKYEYDHTASMQVNRIRAVKSGMTQDEFIKEFVLQNGSRAYVRLFFYKVNQGVLHESQAPRSKRQGRRSRAIVMYAEGKTIDDVMAATGLERSTAMAYRWEASRIKAYQESERDPLCE